MKVFSRGFVLSLFLLFAVHADENQEAHRNTALISRQTIPSFHYMRGVSNNDFRKAGDTTLIETFTINNPGTYTLVQDIGFQAQNNAAIYGGTCVVYINSSNVVLDLGSFTLYSDDTNAHTNTSTQKAIDVAKHKHNITIKNGNISGFVDSGIYVRSGCNNIRIQDVTINNCKKNGIFFAGVLNTALGHSQQIISNCVVDNVTVAETTGITNAHDAVGLKMFHCYNVLVQDSSFGYSNAGTLAAPKDAYGALVESCTAVVFNNCEANGNYGNNVIGFLLSGTTTAAVSTGCSFVNCTANGNNAIIANTAADSTKGVCYAFSGSTVRACTWDNCTANGNEATQTAHGFFYSNAQYCETTHCTANNNIGGNSGLSNLHGARGFYSVSGTGNLWNNCTARGQTVSSQAPSNTMAIGIELDGESYSLVQECQSSNNGDNARVPWGIGINLRHTSASNPSVSCTIDNCRVTNNRSSTAGQGAGIRDADTTTSSLVTNCFGFNNGQSTTANNYAITPVTNFKTITGTYSTMNANFADQLEPYTNVDIT